MGEEGLDLMTRGNAASPHPRPLSGHRAQHGRRERGEAARTAIAAILLGSLLCGGCAAYRFGSQSLYPAHIRTVAVPIFDSSSFRPHLGEQLTEAVVKEIQKRTPFAIANVSEADSVLSGRIVAETRNVAVFNRYNEPRELQERLVVQVTWSDRSNQAIREYQPIPLPNDLLSVSAEANLVPEVGQSGAVTQQQAVQKLAKQIVSMMEAPW